MNYGAEQSFNQMDHHNIEENENQEEVGRPRSLSFLCIMTFIFTGLGALSAIITPLSEDALREYMAIAPAADKDGLEQIMKVIEAGWPYFLTTLVFTLGSMAGSILMWRLKKLGFHFYAISNLALLFVPTLFLGIVSAWYTVFFTLAFIAFYAFHLKFMK